MLKQYAPLLIAALLVCSAFAFYLASRPAAVATAPAAHRPAPPPQLPPPRISKLQSPRSCLHAEGDRYDGGVADSFGTRQAREGVTLVNACTTDVVLVDLKTSDTNISFVYSAQPVRTVVVDTRRGAERAPDRLVILSRGGERCDLQDKLAKSCRFMPIPPGRGLFITVPVRHWFSLMLQGEGAVTGYLQEPVDPKAPPKKRIVLPVPDKGFKFKPLQ